MIAKVGKGAASRRHPLALAGFLLVQILAAVFFVGDVVGDLRADPDSVHFIFEALVTAALVLGDVLVTVPEESRTHKQVVRKAASCARRSR